MVGIVDIGSYLPFLRYNRADWVGTWGMMKEMAAMMLGEKTVANYDEDVITMSAEAGINAIEKIDPKKIDGLFLASTSYPYLEKSSSAIIAQTLDLREDIRSADFANSLRSSTQAVFSAIDAVKAGSCNNVLVIASDLRQSEPKFYMETMMGDSAAAVVIGKDDLICEIEGTATITEEFIDVWRTSDDTYVHYDDERYSSTHGYLKYTPKVLQLLLKNTGIKPESINKIVVYAPEGASYMALAKQSKMPMLFNQDPLLLSSGNTGCVSPLIQLALVLEDANPGDRIVVVSYGDGADAMLLKVTDKISKIKGRRGVKTWVNSKAMINSYVQLLFYRDGIKRINPTKWEFDAFTSVAQLDRSRKSLISFYGNKCPGCGMVFFPQRRICPKCKNTAEKEVIKLAKRGKVFSYEVDNVFPNPVSPVCMAVVDLDKGARFVTQLTDFDPEKVEMGMEVELTLRRYHDAKGFHHYFWKARPVRG